MNGYNRKSHKISHKKCVCPLCILHSFDYSAVSRGSLSYYGEWIEGAVISGLKHWHY